MKLQKAKKSKKSKKKKKKSNRSSTSSDSSSDTSTDEDDSLTDSESEAEASSRQEPVAATYIPPRASSTLKTKEALATSMFMAQTMSPTRAILGSRSRRGDEGPEEEEYDLPGTKTPLINRRKPRKRETPKETEDEDSVEEYDLPGTKTPVINRIKPRKKETPKETEDDDSVDDQNESAAEYSETYGLFEFSDTVKEFHAGKQGCKLAVLEIREVYDILGSGALGVFRVTVQDDNNYATNLLFDNSFKKRVIDELSPGTIYAMEIVKTKIFTKAKHMVRILDWKVIGTLKNTNFRRKKDKNQKITCAK